MVGHTTMDLELMARMKEQFLKCVREGPNESCKLMERSLITAEDVQVAQDLFPRNRIVWIKKQPEDQLWVTQYARGSWDWLWHHRFGRRTSL